MGTFKPTGAGIFVETNPVSSVFINGELSGRTPYEEARKQGEITVKLVPESFEKPLAPYESKVNLVAGVRTVIRWEFGDSEAQGTGEIVSFEKVPKDETSLSVVTIPTSSQVQIDGASAVFTPYKSSSITSGEHTLFFSSKGFSDRTLRVKTESGYKLTAVIQLAENTEFSQELVVEEAPPAEKVVEIEILSTPTGFLRVRDEASTLGEEVAQVKPGEKYKLVDEDEETGWFLIEYKSATSSGEARQGWVSNSYAKKTDDDTDISPTPTP